MNDINQITVFLGWCTAINFSLYSFSALALFVFKDLIINIHSKFSGVHTSKLPTLYFQYLSNYKIAFIVLNLVPYIALRLMV